MGIIAYYQQSNSIFRALCPYLAIEFTSLDVLCRVSLALLQEARLKKLPTAGVTSTLLYMKKDCKGSAIFLILMNSLFSVG